ncbi:hypothetical protein DN752_16575 [Echinicola strongylocentroti]|uniref:Uncharacterized protein n=1 Tax=Echinicola strongylocentroti TaxID=1795355 RepID=A0A2Z4ILK2_9BACT|nr:hypothetical protein [Echinicola strongylocentroti]AWW31607.1 hypothetical protein DN752_16575 [Echinicola strongylocentroti]
MKLIVCMSVIAAVFLASCNDKRDKKEVSGQATSQAEEVMPDIDGVSELQTPPEEAERNEIAEGDLPDEVINMLENDSLLSALQLKKVHKIQKGGDIYYDLAFITDEEETMMVSVSEEGEVLEY